MNVPAVSRVAPVGADRPTIEQAPGFGQALDAILRPERPAGPAEEGGVRFSRHAQARMESRGIVLDERDLQDLGLAIDTLARRGARESLLLLDDHAFIVGVPDRKIITALTRREAVGNVFSQIDSTVVVR